MGQPPAPESYWERQATFWVEAFSLQGTATPLVLGKVAVSGLFALVVTAVNSIEHLPDLGIDVAPYEVAGCLLGVLLVLRTNAGYDRWWEGRKLWGAIVNQSRNLAIMALAYGPDDPSWRDRFVRWAAAFGHAARRSLRGQRELPELAALLGPEAAGRVAAADHMPSAVARELAALLRDARDCELDGFAFLKLDDERARLIDHVGGCERILSTPLPRAYAINTRRFIILFLGTLPFALLVKVGWLTPLVTMLVAYVLLSLDTIGAELQNPFSTRSLNHLPLDAICAKIEQNLLALLAADRVDPRLDGPATGPLQSEAEGVQRV